VTFVGDVNLGLGVGAAIERRADAGTASGVAAAFPFDGVAAALAQADLLVGNLECVASRRGLSSTDHNPFRCTRAPELLVAAGFDLVSVANNHALDYGRVGFDDMLAALDGAGLPHVGREAIDHAPQAAFVRTIRGVRVGVLGYYDPHDEPLADVRRARSRSDVLLTFMHWGREDEPAPLPLQQKLARELVDAGVDVVVGTHAHVPQPMEWYRGKLIAYGLGNFVFSGMTHSELHRTGLMLELDVAPRGVIAHRVVTVRLGEDGAPLIHRPAAVLSPPGVDGAR
jgi:poly-gamma-glutamate synthesis protein (capsule biosynthesis protein)